MQLEEYVEYLVSPRSKRPLRLAEGGGKDLKALGPASRTGPGPEAVGSTSRLLLSEDGRSAYPVVDGFPILLAPEKLLSEDERDRRGTLDLTDPRYAEAYEEMEVYNTYCAKQLLEIRKKGEPPRNLMGALTPATDLSRCELPQPEELWLDARHDVLGQLEAYSYLAPPRGRVFLQLGGCGTHAVKMLLAGAEKAFLITPMIGEVRLAMQLAEDYGVVAGLGCVVGIGEEIPFRDGAVDLVYSGGCFHHMRLDFLAEELHRILVPGGRFAGVDPWKTPLHTIGTRLLGKREESVFCRPITPARLAPMQRRFSGMVVNHHGPVLRYLFLALEKLGLELSLRSMLKVARWDDRLGAGIGLAEYGGSLLLAGAKEASRTEVAEGSRRLSPSDYVEPAVDRK